MAQSRRFGPPSITSDSPPEADTVTDGRHISKVPRGDISANLQPGEPANARAGEPDDSSTLNDGRGRYCICRQQHN